MKESIKDNTVQKFPRNLKSQLFLIIWVAVTTIVKSIDFFSATNTRSQWDYLWMFVWVILILLVIYEFSRPVIKITANEIIKPGIFWTRRVKINTLTEAYGWDRHYVFKTPDRTLRIKANSIRKKDIAIFQETFQKISNTIEG